MNFADIVQRATVKLVGTALEHPLAAEAVGRVNDLRDVALIAQDAVLGALNLPSASDVSRLDTRLRSMSQRLEGIEDALDETSAQVRALAPALRRIDERFAARGEAGAAAERVL
ncbi:hypothetical protein [Nocardia sp. NBC_01388]|uniref:hypothetical protein n=1 Tax=Nocardia sp. NBC_01388 TaxID=2903596 RepID=UPI003250183C